MKTECATCGQEVDRQSRNWRSIGAGFVHIVCPSSASDATKDITQEQRDEFLSVLASKFSTFCLACMEEMDLRDPNQKQIANGYFVHIACPPKSAE